MVRTARALCLVGSCGLVGLTGCAGGYGTYGPGMAEEIRTSKGVTPDYPGATRGTYHERTYESGAIGFGAQLGARAGIANVTVGSIGSGAGLAVDAHADLVLAAERWGVGVTGGYTADRVSVEKDDYSFTGFPIGAYGQLGIVPRFFLHAGAGRTVAGSVTRIDGNGKPEVSSSADAWRAFGGATWVFARSDVRDFALRVEARGTFGGSATIDARDATWTSLGVLGEVMWITF